MSEAGVNYELIEDAKGLAKFAAENQGIEWMCFDTEFIGEKRFLTLICLIQIGTPKGFYLVDPLKVKDLQPIIDMLVDEKVLKIVHAGDNDYRLFNTHYGILPLNTFDTQMAASFIGYKHPVGFSKLVESELDIMVSKGYTVTDWEKRPFQPKQLKYALHDVVHLYDLWVKISKQLEKKGRLNWAYEEFKALEDPASYETDPYKEVLESNIVKSLRKREQVFLLRLMLWRTEEAQRRNHSKEMVLPSKYIGAIVRAVHSGLDALQTDRRLPDSMIGKFGKKFVELYEAPTTEHEKEVLSRLPRDNSDNPKQDILMEMLDLLVRYKCLQEGISHHIVMPRGVLRKMKNDKDYFDDAVFAGWRREFLGDEIVSWFKHRRNLEIKFLDGKFELKMQEAEVE